MLQGSDVRIPLCLGCGAVAPLAGSSCPICQRAYALYRPEPSAPPEGVRYSDTGQRSSGSEVSIDTKLGQAAAWSQVVAIFRVEL